MKYLLLFFLIFSCTHKSESAKKNSESSLWDKLESISSNLSPDSVKEKLGEPTHSESLKRKIIWSYFNLHTKLLNWKLELNDSGKLKKISYFPSADGVVFTTQSVEKNWSGRNCIFKKIETLTLTHSHPYIGKIICEDGKYTLYFDLEGQIQEVEIR